MKKIASFILIVLCCLSACTPDNPSMDFENIVDDPRIKVFDMADDNSFMIVNGMKGKILPPKWDLGNGQTAIGDTVYVGYAFAGSYIVSMTGFDGEKEFTISRTIRTTQDNMALVSDPVYNFLTGGVAAENGKTWVLDSLRTGHVRLWKRQTGQVSDDKKIPLFYAGAGMYDDEITFKLLGSTCNYENHGQSFSHGGTIDGIERYRIEQLKQMGIVTGYTNSPKGDYLVNYTPGTQPQKWSLVKRTEKVNNVDKDVYYLKLTGGAYMFFYRGNKPDDIEYKIDSIAENYLRVIHYETYPASRATAQWEEHYLLVPKGYPIQPETPVVPDPPKEDNINEDFEGATQSLTLTPVGAVQWMGLPTYSVVDNISMTGINPWNKIARFVRGGGSDEHLKVVRSNTIKLTDKNKIKMMVYMPSTNNYLNVNLKPTVEVRLANSKNTSQAMAVQTITVASTNFDKWIELTFDFSGSANITTFDTWIFQFGGQYPNGTASSQGIFYFDNIKLQN